jgi:hypothetical protein
MLCLPLQLSATFLQLAMQAVQTHQQQQQQSQQPLAPGDTSQPALSPAALLQYLPLPGDVSDSFMGQVSTAILQGLSTQPCVLTASGTLSSPADTLLLDTLLATACGPEQQPQQLISNEWLQQGLPGVQFVSDTLLSGSEAARTLQVLQQLGCRKFSAKLLLSWLGTEGTAQLLGSLGREERTAWLPALYSCCMQLKAQPFETAVHLGPDLTALQTFKTAPILQLYGSSESVSLQQLAGSGRQVYLWDSTMGDEPDLVLISQAALCPAQDSAKACAATATGAPASSAGNSNRRSSSQQDTLCFVDPSTLGPDGTMFLCVFLGVNTVRLSVLPLRILKLQAAGMLSDSQQDQLLLFLLRNASMLSSQDLQLLKEGLQLRSADGGSRQYLPAWRMRLPLHATSISAVSEAALSDPSLQQDLTAAGVLFTSDHYAGLSAALQGTGRQGVWQLLRSFGVQELTLAGTVQQLLKLYSSTDMGNQPVQVSMSDHQRHLQFLSEAARDPASLRHIKQGLRLYHIRQDPAAAVPTSFLHELFWPMRSTAGANDITDQLSLVCGVQLVHPLYVLHQLPGTFVKSLTTTLTPPEVRT